MENCKDCKYDELSCNEEPCDKCEDYNGHFTGFVPKEGEKKVKTYKTWEAIKMLTESQDPNLKFKKGQAEIYLNDRRFLSGNFNGHEGINGNLKLVNDEWELVQQEVPFLEAANSNKRIRPDDEDFPDYDYIHDWVEHIFSAMTTETYLELINGKWFIE